MCVFERIKLYRLSCEGNRAIHIAREFTGDTDDQTYHRTEVGGNVTLVILIDYEKKNEKKNEIKTYRR